MRRLRQIQPVLILEIFPITHLTSLFLGFRSRRLRRFNRVIDYTLEDFTRKGQRYDWIIDFTGYHSIRDYQRTLSPQGNYVIVSGATSLVSQITFLGPLLSLTAGKKMSLLLHKPNNGLESLTELFAAGKVRPVADKRYPLCEAAEALRYFGAGQARGKVVITIP